MTAPILPLQLAIRLVLDNVSYSNPLPDWHTPLRASYTELEKRIQKRIERYQSGKERPLPALAVLVPNRLGELRTWKLPAVNDQIILQACTSTLADQILSFLDFERVFSYRRSDDANHLALVRNQFLSWFDFQEETQRRLKEESNKFLLQIDIRRAFPSVDRRKFYGFIEENIRPRDGVMALLRLLLESFSGKDAGLPLINDTVFFLGNAYLWVIDEVVRDHMGKEDRFDFIRFMDDYRIFGDSEDGLEAIYEGINQDLHSRGFAINDLKVRLGSAAEYLETLPTPELSETNSHYISSLVGGVMDPEQVVALIVKTLNKPERYLHAGFGRFLLGTLRRFRYESAIARRIGAEAAVDGLRTLLEDSDAIPLAVHLLRTYQEDPQQVWRTVWLIYLLEHVRPTEEILSLLQDLAERPGAPPVVRLWARRCHGGWQPDREILPEDLHDLGYLEAGQRCYGEQPCEDGTS